MSGVASQPTDNSDSTKSSSSGSKAWIAAAAAGPVVALLVIGALIFRWKQKRAKKIAEESDVSTQDKQEAAGQFPKSDEVSELP